MSKTYPLRLDLMHQMPKCLFLIDPFPLRFTRMPSSHQTTVASTITPSETINNWPSHGYICCCEDGEAVDAV